MSRIPVFLVAAMLSCACGVRSPAIRSDVSLASRFPSGDVPLVRSGVSSVLPSRSLAVLIAPSLGTIARHIERGSAGNADMRASLGRVLVERVGQDILDLEAMRAMSVRTDAAVALAWLDRDTVAVVLPLEDATAFAARWRGARSSTHVIHRPGYVTGGHGYAVIAFNLGDVFDPSGEVVGQLSTVTPETSLAAHDGLREAASRLRYGPDMVLLVNPRAGHHALAGYFDAERGALDLQAVRDLVDMAEQLSDRDTLSDALDELAAMESGAARLDNWQSVVDELLAPLAGVALGVGLERSTIKVQAALAFAPEADPAGFLTALPGELRQAGGGGLSLAAHLPQRTLLPVLRVILERRAYRQVNDLVAALGGHTALDGTVAISYREIGARGAHRRPLRVRLGLREPDGARAHLGQAPTAAGWHTRVLGPYLVLERGPSSSRARVGRALPQRDRANTGDRGTVSLSISAHWHDIFFDPDSRPRGRDGHTVVRSELSSSSLLSSDASKEDLAAFTAMLAERTRLEVQRDYAQIDAREALLRALGQSTISASTVSAQDDDERVLVVHGVTALHRDRDTGDTGDTGDTDAQAETIGHGLRVWYETSEQSPRGHRLAELNERITAMETRLADRGARDMLGSGPDDRVIVIYNAGQGQSPGTLRVIHPPGPLGSSATTLARDTETAYSLAPTRHRVSVSITHADPQLDRAILDQALLRALRPLQGCYADHRATHADAEGYLRAELRVSEARLDVMELNVMELEPAASATNLHQGELAACLREALRHARVLTPAQKAQKAQKVPKVQGKATATVWFGN